MPLPHRFATCPSATGEKPSADQRDPISSICRTVWSPLTSHILYTHTHTLQTFTLTWPSTHTYPQERCPPTPPTSATHQRLGALQQPMGTIATNVGPKTRGKNGWFLTRPRITLAVASARRGPLTRASVSNSTCTRSKARPEPSHKQAVETGRQKQETQ